MLSHVWTRKLIARETDAVKRAKEQKVAAGQTLSRPPNLRRIEG